MALTWGVEVGWVVYGRFIGAAALILLGLATTERASAELLNDALASAYSNNSDLNAARAAVRAADEGVPQALAGFRPRVNGNAQARLWEAHRSGADPTWRESYKTPSSFGISIEQPIYLGMRTKNSVKMAQTAVLAARELLKTSEADILLQAVQAFMDVVRAQVVLNLTAQNVTFLREQVKASNDRLSVGEGTKTDVAQTNARLATGELDYAGAVANLSTAIATYEQVIGHKPTTLGAYNGIHKLLPASLDDAIALAIRIHPSIVAGLYNVDIASYNVKIIEGSLLPTLSLSGRYDHSDSERTTGVFGKKIDGWNDLASVQANLSVPIYNGGEVASQVRESKETLGQRQIELDSIRAAVKQFVISAWGQLRAAEAQVTAAQSAVEAQQLALSGVIEEQKVGQRTTLDVLNAQQDLLTARVDLVNAHYTRVVATYAVLSAIGRLNAPTLSLRVDVYDPGDHYNAVKDKWLGLRTPDGR